MSIHFVLLGSLPWKGDALFAVALSWRIACVRGKCSTQWRCHWHGAACCQCTIEGQPSLVSGGARFAVVEPWRGAGRRQHTMEGQLAVMHCWDQSPWKGGGAPCSGIATAQWQLYSNNLMQIMLTLFFGLWQWAACGALQTTDQALSGSGRWQLPAAIRQLKGTHKVQQWASKNMQQALFGRCWTMEGGWQAAERCRQWAVSGERRATSSEWPAAWGGRAQTIGRLSIA